MTRPLPTQKTRAQPVTIHYDVDDLLGDNPRCRHGWTRAHPWSNVPGDLRNCPGPTPHHAVVDVLTPEWSDQILDPFKTGNHEVTS